MVQKPFRMIGHTFPSQIKFHSCRKHLLHLQTLRLLATVIRSILESPAGHIPIAYTKSRDLENGAKGERNW